METSFSSKVFHLSPIPGLKLTFAFSGATDTLLPRIDIRGADGRRRPDFPPRIHHHLSLLALRFAPPRRAPDRREHRRGLHSVRGRERNGLPRKERHRELPEDVRRSEEQ